MAINTPFCVPVQTKRDLEFGDQLNAMRDENAFDAGMVGVLIGAIAAGAGTYSAVEREVAVEASIAAAAAAAAAGDESQASSASAASSVDDE